MAVLARLYDFTPGTTITSAEVDAELNQIINALTGVKVNGAHALGYNDSDTPTLTVDNTGAGDIVSFEAGGVEVALVNAVGQFESVLATGTAPLKVASTTKVDNLNADLLDGLSSADFLSATASGTLLAADPYLDFDDSGADDTIRVQNLNGDFLVKNTTDNQNLLLIDGDTELATFYGKVAGLAATADNQFVTKAQLEAAEHFVQVGGYFDGAPAVGQFGYWLPASAHWQLAGAGSVLASYLVCEMTGGSGTTTFELRYYAPNLLSYDVLATMSITGAVAGVDKVSDSGGAAFPGALDEGFFVWVCTAVGTHQNISLSTEIQFFVI